ncbi:MarR family transcriptional regulator [Nonomuraea sp. NN258]|uniref:GbsR/MarR family transcriptional regulator n=1 Tax=Nonomuraea antri TaxID=2730852 RepID=UPI0015681049|nr:helix-turn-helix domain-containing protein [Nonomuraea antri]NRQ36950.1 MarR family transcriptional regulator [Nonomuraea antri]
MGEQERWQAAERLALALSEGGLQRMAARALAVFLFTDGGTVTMGDIAGRLGVSAGSVSGAVKSLLSAGLIERLPAPGSRREHYRLREDAWPRLFSTQNTFVHVMIQAAESGIATTAAGDPAHERLTRMRDFYRFLLGELPGLLRRWEETRAPD